MCLCWKLSCMCADKEKSKQRKIWSTPLAETFIFECGGWVAFQKKNEKIRMIFRGLVRAFQYVKSKRRNIMCEWKRESWEKEHRDCLTGKKSVKRLLERSSEEERQGGKAKNRDHSIDKFFYGTIPTCMSVMCVTQRLCVDPHIYTNARTLTSGLTTDKKMICLCPTVCVYVHTHN